ncbi:MAG TPA: NrfD/PsrC family molybdoenzyme membrane anchor subunit [Candidatus Limnocylindrales bacterium]|nr:NrfD/PsrC family molybdoenzyme membrane anchor subunit [Candidatus Limnocylindrales bacterium]
MTTGEEARSMASRAPVPNPLAEPVLIDPGKSFADISAEVAAPIEKKPGMLWWIFFGIAVLLTGQFAAEITYQIIKGVGIWGLNHPVGWAVDITSFVFWIGIGHAGTLISAILHLFRQRWRTAINRSAEAMTIFAVMTAGLFPLIHTGRPWFAYWLVPYPNWRHLWVNFRSPLVWDVFAVSTYLTISLCFWFTGLIPDFATLRDRSAGWRRGIYSVLSLGWRGSERHWQHYERAYMMLAGISTPLVLSVHSIVSFDFATSILPGWHTTIFPPYFVAGAIFSGFAMVVTLLVILRKVFKMEEYVTIHHLENMNKIILVTGMMVGYAYAVEMFIAVLYSGNQFEHFTFVNRATGPFAWAYWIMVSCNVLVPQVFWFKRFRRSIPVMFAVSILVNVGMWFERFTIIVTSLHRDFIPTAWSYYKPTIFDYSVIVGSFGFFFMWFLLFCRFFPTISIAEVKSVLWNAKKSAGRVPAGKADAERAHV